MVSADTANDTRSIIVMEQSILPSDITNSLKGNDLYGGEQPVLSQPYYESTQSDTHSPPQTQLGSWLHNVRFCDSQLSLILNVLIVFFLP